MKCRCEILAVFVLFAFVAQLLASDQERPARKPPTAEEKARGAAMLDTFASEFLPRTFMRYKQVVEKFALSSKTLVDLEAYIRENGGEPANDENYKGLQAKRETLLQQVYWIRDYLFGCYCYWKMDAFSSERFLKDDESFAAWIDAECLTKKAVAPKGE